MKKTTKLDKLDTESQRFFDRIRKEYQLTSAGLELLRVACFTLARWNEARQILEKTGYKDFQIDDNGGLRAAKNNVDFNGFRVSADKEIKEEGIGNTILSFLFTFLLYMSLLFTGQMTMSAVIEEKSNKIVEVLLSSVSSRELMTGKIIGTAITALVQMAIWLSPLIILISTTWFVLPPEFTLKLSMWHLLFFMLNYFIALITFLGLFATVGSIFDNPQDAQSGIWPIMMLIIIPFFIAIGMQTNPENQIARIASFVPFASLIIMPARITLVDIPLLQLVLSIITNIAVMILIFILAGKIYRVGILITGKKPKWSEVVKWFKYNY